MWYEFTLINGKWWNTGHYVMAQQQPPATATTKYVYWKDC